MRRYDFQPVSNAHAKSEFYRDLAQLEKMRSLGMKPEDEYKLTAMREYISKLAAARQG